MNFSCVQPVSSKDFSWTARRPKDSSLNVDKAHRTLRNKPLEVREALEKMKKEMEQTTSQNTLDYLKKQQNREFIRELKVNPKSARMKEFTRIFPFKFQGEMKLNDWERGAKILRGVEPFEKKAVFHMENALNQWETS